MYFSFSPFYQKLHSTHKKLPKELHHKYQISMKSFKIQEKDLNLLFSNKNFSLKISRKKKY